MTQIELLLTLTRKELRTEVAKLRQDWHTALLSRKEEDIRASGIKYQIANNLYRNN